MMAYERYGILLRTNCIHCGVITSYDLYCIQFCSISTSYAPSKMILNIDIYSRQGRELFILATVQQHFVSRFLDGEIWYVVRLHYVFTY